MRQNAAAITLTYKHTHIAGHGARARGTLEHDARKMIANREKRLSAEQQKMGTKCHRNMAIWCLVCVAVARQIRIHVDRVVCCAYLGRPRASETQSSISRENKMKKIGNLMFIFTLSLPAANGCDET